MKPMHATERGNGWDVRTEETHVDSEQEDGETAIEE